MQAVSYSQEKSNWSIPCKIDDSVSTSYLARDAISVSRNAILIARK